ncbi:MAG: hypothetical protein QXU18_12385 [Thermoplasmatales archaeon]
MIPRDYEAEEAYDDEIPVEPIKRIGVSMKVTVYDRNGDVIAVILTNNPFDITRVLGNDGTVLFN